MSEVVVVDVETTGFHRGSDSVLEVAAVTVNLEAGTIKDLYNNLCRPGGRWRMRRNLERAWIVRQDVIKVDEVLEALPEEVVAAEFRHVLGERNGRWTAYNLEFEERFLLGETWDIWPTKLPCLMLAAAPVCKLPNRYGYSDYKWPSLEEAYELIVGRELEGHHRALEDARHAAEVMLKLIEMGAYQVEGEA